MYKMAFYTIRQFIVEDQNLNGSPNQVYDTINDQIIGGESGVSYINVDR